MKVTLGKKCSKQGGFRYLKHPAGCRVRKHDATISIAYQDTVAHAIDDGFDLRFFCSDVPEGFFTLPSKKLRLFLEVSFFQGPSHHNAELIRREGFGDEVIGTFLHRLNGRLDSRISGDDDDQEIGIDGPNVIQYLHSAHARHHQIEQNDVDFFRLALNLVKTFCPILSGDDCPAVLGKDSS